jgi:hypothetical protein
VIGALFVPVGHRLGEHACQRFPGSSRTELHRILRRAAPLETEKTLIRYRSAFGRF